METILSMSQLSHISWRCRSRQWAWRLSRRCRRQLPLTVAHAALPAAPADLPWRRQMRRRTPPLLARARKEKRDHDMRIRTAARRGWDYCAAILVDTDHVALCCVCTVGPMARSTGKGGCDRCSVHAGVFAAVRGTQGLPSEPPLRGRDARRGPGIFGSTAEAEEGPAHARSCMHNQRVGHSGQRPAHPHTHRRRQPVPRPRIGLTRIAGHLAALGSLPSRGCEAGGAAPRRHAPDTPSSSPRTDTTRADAHYHSLTRLVDLECGCVQTRLPWAAFASLHCCCPAAAATVQTALRSDAAWRRRVRLSTSRWRLAELHTCLHSSLKSLQQHTGGQLQIAKSCQLAPSGNHADSVL